LPALYGRGDRAHRRDAEIGIVIEHALGTKPSEELMPANGEEIRVGGWMRLDEQDARRAFGVVRAEAQALFVRMTSKPSGPEVLVGKGTR
jgi:hypothetical protein